MSTGVFLKNVFQMSRRCTPVLAFAGSGVLSAASMVWYSKSATVMANSTDSWKNASSIYEFSYVDIDGKPRSMKDYKGQVLVVTNLASKCTLTTVNYQQLTALHEKYGSQGLRIIGFPCNQFANQEPDSEPEIKKFISQFNVKFDMSSKIEVNGEGAHPLWKYLKSKQGDGILGNSIKWNFTKFLIDKKGNVVQRYGPTSEPKEMEPDILRLLQE